jgi:hypothetical protein
VPSFLNRRGKIIRLKKTRAKSPFRFKTGVEMFKPIIITPLNPKLIAGLMIKILDIGTKHINMYRSCFAFYVSHT